MLLDEADRRGDLQELSAQILTGTYSALSMAVIIRRGFHTTPYRQSWGVVFWGELGKGLINLWDEQYSCNDTKVPLLGRFSGHNAKRKRAPALQTTFRAGKPGMTEPPTTRGEEVARVVDGGSKRPEAGPASAT